MSFMKELINGVVKKFEVFERFFHNKDKNIDYKTRLDAEDVEDMSYLHLMHDYMSKNWILVIDGKQTPYVSPLYGYLERKKALLVSLDGRGRIEMENILKPEINENEEKKNTWDRMVSS